MIKINVKSEIGKLNKVILHRPSWELERITPKVLSEVLFEDIPWLKAMQSEHDAFAEALKSCGAEVIYIEDMAIKMLKEENIKSKLLEEVIENEVQYSLSVKDKIREFMFSLSDSDFIKYITGGLSPNEIKLHEHGLSEYFSHDDFYYFKPIPNLYFSRDSAAIAGSGIIISSFESNIRKRESAIMRGIVNSGAFGETSIYYGDYPGMMNIECGVILVLSEDTLCVGCSQRTNAYAIETLAENMLLNEETGFKKIIAVEIPHTRSFMHLDTVMTMADYDKFVVYPGILDSLKVGVMTAGKNGVKLKTDLSLPHVLEECLNTNGITLINSGGSNPRTAAREQWNDSTNTLAVAPGRVITYDRNEVTNELLDKNGIDIITIPGSELVRGRGGPRCMSMPLIRENI